MTSHELANELLTLPDLPVVNSEGIEIDSAEEDGEEVVLFSEDDDDEESETTSESEV